MRCHLVTAPEIERDGEPTILRRYVANLSDVAEQGREWQEKYGFKRGQVTSEQVEVPTQRDELLAYLNQLLA